MTPDDEELDEQLDDQPLPPADPQIWPGAEPKQAAFLTALVLMAGRRSLAARAAKVARSTHYRWMETDANYKLLYERAMLQVVEVLEDEATTRAVEGVRKGIYFQGCRVATERVYSDGLMMFLLRGAAPDKYREKTEHSGAVDLNLRFKGSLTELLATYRELASEETADAG